MDVSTLYADPVKEDVICPHHCGQLWINHMQSTSTIGGCSVAELESAGEDIMVLLSASTPPLNRCEICLLEKYEECEELIIHQVESLNVTSQTSSGECAVFPCSRNMLLCGIPVSGKEETSSTALHEKISVESGNPTCTSVTSLPTTMNLVSAMKGSRKKWGLHLEKLTVTWAPDVYDPPATSLSHTVKSHNQQCSRTAKKNYKHKHMHKHKAKSSRNSSIVKKQCRKPARSSHLCS